MARRQLVQIPSEQVKKLLEIEKIRKDLADYPISKKVHMLLQERLAEILKYKVIAEKESKKIKENWFEYIREKIPVHVFAPIAIGVTRYSKEMIGEGYTKIISSGEGDKTWWFNYKDDVYNIGGFLLSNLNQKKFSRDYYRKYEEMYKDMRKICKILREEDFSKLTKKQLLHEYREFEDKFMHFHALFFDIDSIDIFLEERMKDKFKEMVKEGFNEKYSRLTNPIELSYVNVEQLELLRAAKKIKESDVKKIFGKSVEEIVVKLPHISPEIEREILKLVEKYWWTSLSWSSREEKDFKSYVKDIKRILEEKNIDSEIGKLERFAEEKKEEKRKLDQEVGFDEEITFYLEVFEKYFVFHDYRKEIQMKGTSIMNKFLEEISRRYCIRFEDLVWCFPSEIQDYIRSGTIDLDKAGRRKGAYFFLITKDEVKEYTGEEAIKKRKEVRMENMENIYDFRGIGASLGKVKGKARICHSATEAVKKIQKGDILVTSMTTPDYVVAMKKTAAIVTDEGGITCHAAIVSRELGIPCITGTRIATRVLKDGDLIEANANHNTVRIIERA